MTATLATTSDLSVVTVQTDDLPRALAVAAIQFNAISPEARVHLLLDYARHLPAPAPELGENTDLFERVEECQDAVHLRAVVTGSRVRIHALVAEDAPTVRGLVSILVKTLDGLSVREVLAVPADAFLRLDLDEAVGAFRMRAATGLLARLQRQVREQS